MFALFALRLKPALNPLSLSLFLQVRSEDICTGGRFEIDCESLFLFSSTEGSMMPGNISLRTVRVEQVYR